jgi:hypothetical protein
METFHGIRPTEISKGYDEKYSSSNYFGYREWLYRPFVKALVAKIRLCPGARLLDIFGKTGILPASVARV